MPMRLKMLTAIFCLGLDFSGASDLDSIPGRLDLVKLSDRIYISEDHYFHRENSVVYIGDSEVTVLSATWTPGTARLLAEKIRRVTDKPIKAVVNTHHHLDRAGGNPYFKRIGATIIASRKTDSLMTAKWEKSVASARVDFPGYPLVPHVSVDTTFDNIYERENGAIR